MSGGEAGLAHHPLHVGDRDDAHGQPGAVDDGGAAHAGERRTLEQVGDVVSRGTNRAGSRSARSVRRSSHARSAGERASTR